MHRKKTFGGLSFLLQGNVACGVLKDDMIVRIEPGQHDAAIANPHVRTFDYTGRPMKGWIMVGPNALASDEDIKEWAFKGVQYALSLPPNNTHPGAVKGGAFPPQVLQDNALRYRVHSRCRSLRTVL